MNSRTGGTILNAGHRVPPSRFRVWFPAVVIFCLHLLLLNACTENVALRGGGSEAGNSIYGLIREGLEEGTGDESCSRVEGAKVRLYPRDHNPAGHDTLPQEWTVRTDSRGEYLFKKVGAGSYNIQAWHPDDNSVALEREIVMTESRTEGRDAGTAVLRAPSVVSVPLTQFSVEAGGCFYLPGTGVYREIDSAVLKQGYLDLTGIPEGRYREFAYAGAGFTLDMTILKDITLAPSDSVALARLPDRHRAVVVYGALVTTDGGPAAGAGVKLVPAEYVPSDSSSLPRSLVGITDERGTYIFQGVEQGTYSLEAFKPYSGSALLVQGIEVSGDSTAVPAHALQRTGTLTIYLPDTIAVQGGFFHIPGTSIYQRIDVTSMKRRFLIMGSMPPGDYARVLFGPESDPGWYLTHAENFQVLPGRNTVISAYCAWERSYRITINTGVGGAEIETNVFAFPLLVRLDSSISPPLFDSGPGDGSDLRFASSNGVPLAYQVERWDDRRKEAEVWVRLDTVYAGNSDQHIYMYAGKGGAGDESSGPGVFRIEDGYAGVWHLAEKGNDSADGYRDATAYANHGTAVNMTSGSDADGAVGRAQAFSGDSNFIRVPDASSLKIGTGDFTGSAFIRLDELGEKQQVFCKRRALPKGDYELQVDPDSSLATYLQWSEGPDTLHSAARLETGRWYHVAVKRESGTIYLYINGERQPETFFCSMDLSSTSDLFIGMDSYLRSEFFHGIIDEVRISAVARPGPWIKLGYETQKRGSGVLKIE